ncbi:7tm 6 domain containing protein [Asbolus verrucosus]|uniref:Odorant receptor n=1 Tax=Asbolus verrucosus TaxID=1661398 RepID=A0A482W650_ASBVE|nr:7tm 6 domain containing protein [Asbolus verrucosus]
MQETRFDWKRTIRLNIVVLKILGLWPPGDEICGCTFYTLYEILNLLFLQIVVIVFQTVNLFLNIDDLKVVTGTIFVLLMEMLAPTKCYTIIKNTRILKQLMATINDDLFQPRNSQQLTLVQPNINAWRKTVATFWFFTLGWLLFLILYPIFDKTANESPLPFLAWYPYSIKASPLYELSYFHQIISVSTMSMVHINIDSLIAALNMYIGAQFDILCDNLRNFYDSGTDSPTDAEEKLKNCISHHKKILKFAEYTNEFYNWLIFQEFFVGGISIGLSMFQMTVVVPFSNEFHSFMSYSTAVSVQVFMYCWFGNEIELKSSKLPYAIFESDWTSLPPKIKKELIIFFIRVQQPLKMSAFGLFYLSLETFVKILRTSWSYFALLRQINSPKNN